MKKVFAVLLALFVAVAFAGVTVAADNAAKPAAGGQDPAAVKNGEQAAPAATPAPAKKAGAAPAVGGQDPAAAKKGEKAAKTKPQEVTGTIEALDAKAGTFTVKGTTGNVDLKAGDKVKLGSFKVGDKVTVKYAEGKATSVKAAKAKKAAAPGEDPAAVKKGEKAAPAPAPAAPPAKK